jgi:hypothetical protein
VTPRAEPQITRRTRSDTDGAAALIERALATHFILDLDEMRQIGVERVQRVVDRLHRLTQPAHVNEADRVVERITPVAKLRVAERLPGRVDLMERGHALFDLDERRNDHPFDRFQLTLQLAPEGIDVVVLRK